MINKVAMRTYYFKIILYDIIHKSYISSNKPQKSTFNIEKGKF